MNKKNVLKISEWIGLGLAVGLVLGSAAGIYQMRDSKYQKLYKDIQKENQKLRDELGKTPRPAQNVSGKLRRGSAICWNNDVELTDFDVKPSGETSLEFKSGGKTINRKCTFGERVTPIPGNMGNLTFTVIRPKAHVSWVNWADNFEFEATYEPFTKTDDIK